MKLLAESTIKAARSEDAAEALMEAAPRVVRWVRQEMRTERLAGLKVPQFRALVFLSRHPGASLTAVAGFMSITLSYSSRLVDGLVEEELVNRSSRAGNRRSVTLDLTPAGQAALRQARRHTRRRLAALMATLPADAQAALSGAADALRDLGTRLHETHGTEGTARP